MGSSCNNWQKVLECCNLYQEVCVLIRDRGNTLDTKSLQLTRFDWAIFPGKLVYHLKLETFKLQALLWACLNILSTN